MVIFSRRPALSDIPADTIAEAKRIADEATSGLLCVIGASRHSGGDLI